MNFVTCQQTHSNNIHIVTVDDIGKVIPNCDGLITNIEKVSISVKTADCVPITINDPVKKVVGVVHAGWRGTLNKIAQKAVEKMIYKFNSDPKDIKIKVGASIDKNNFLVRHDVYDLFANVYSDFFEMVSEDQWEFDLVGVNCDQLLNMGIPVANIELSNISTYLDNNYPSFRRDGKTEGFVTKIMLK